METLQLLRKFVNQRPGLNFKDYGDRTIYRRESREITKDLHDFNEVLNVARFRVPDLDSKVKDYLQKTSGRLLMDEKERLVYHEGQYFPTEYRPAATRVIANILWEQIRQDKTLETGHDIRKKLSKMLSKRVMKNYFN